MPLHSSEIPNFRAGILDRSEFWSDEFIAKHSETIRKLEERVKQHLRNPHCAGVIVQDGSEDLVICCNISTAARGDQPMVVFEGTSSNFKIQQVHPNDKGSGGEYVESAHLREEHGHIDGNTVPYLFKKPFKVTYQGQSMNMDFVQRRYQGVTLLTQGFHDEKMPDLFGWALVLQIVLPGILTCEFLNVLMNLESGDVKWKGGSFSTPRWGSIKLLDFDSDLASAFASGGQEEAHAPSLAPCHQVFVQKRQRLQDAAAAFAGMREKEIAELDAIDGKLTTLKHKSEAGDGLSLAFDVGALVVGAATGWGIILGIAAIVTGVATYKFEKKGDEQEEEKIKAMEENESSIRNEFMEAMRSLHEEVKNQTGEGDDAIVWEVTAKVLVCHDVLDGVPVALDAAKWAKKAGEAGDIAADVGKIGEKVAEVGKVLEPFAEQMDKAAPWFIGLGLLSLIHTCITTPPTQQNVRDEREQFQTSLGHLQTIAQAHVV